MVISVRDSQIRDVIKRNGDYHAKFMSVDTDKVYKVANNVEVKDYFLSKTIGYGIVSKIEKTDRDSDRLPPNRYLYISAYDQSGLKTIPINIKEGRLPQTEDELAIDITVLEQLPGKPKLGDKVKLNIGMRKDPASGQQMERNGWSSNEIFEKTGEKELTVRGRSWHILQSRSIRN
jgi:putative ABC transport system permease protein